MRFERCNDCVAASDSCPGPTNEAVLGCHPADGMALALRAGAPILAADTAMAHARTLDRPSSTDEVRRWLNGVEPGDWAAGA